MNTTLRNSLIALGILAVGSLALYEIDSKGVDAVVDSTVRCVMPACWNDAGVWDNTRVVDCKFGGHLAWTGSGPKPLDKDIAPRWIGCSVQDSTLAVGTECVPVPCVATAGLEPEVELVAIQKSAVVSIDGGAIIIGEEVIP